MAGANGTIRPLPQSQSVIMIYGGGILVTILNILAIIYFAERV